MHSDIRDYQCEFCDAKFKQQSSVYRHLKIHVFRKTYKCTVCAAGFKLKEVLRRHEQTHEEKKYMCYLSCKF